MKRHLIAVPIAVIALAGCGGDDDKDSNKALSYEDTGKELNELCTESKGKIEAVSDGVTPEANAASGEALAKIVVLVKEFQTSFGKLKPAEELEPTFEEAKANIAASVAATEAAKAAADSGDQAAYDASLKEVQKLDIEGDLQASKLGADACTN